MSAWKYVVYGIRKPSRVSIEVFMSLLSTLQQQLKELQTKSSESSNNGYGYDIGNGVGYSSGCKQIERLWRSKWIGVIAGGLEGGEEVNKKLTKVEKDLVFRALDRASASVCVGTYEHIE